MVATYRGAIDWNMSRDKDGFREYHLTSLVAVDDGDGPATALQAAGLATPGSYWQVRNDVDLYAWCRWDASVKPYQAKNDPTKFFTIEQVFSTKPPETNSCVQQQIDNPLLQPHRVSGGSTKYQEEATHDRYGYALLNSAFQQIRGPQVEFDKNRPTIKIEQNVAVLDLALCNSMVDTVNDRPLWGLPRRCIKLSGFDWEAKYYGTCLKYYVRKFDFDASYKLDQFSGVVRSGFDRDVLDEGTKALRGRWNTDGQWELIQINGQDPNPLNPSHFDLFTDRNGNPITGILNGFGVPYQPGSDNEAKWWCLIGQRIDPAGGVNEAGLDVEAWIYNTECFNGTCRQAYARARTLAADGSTYVVLGPFSGANEGEEQTNCNDNCFEDNFLPEFIGNGNAPATQMKVKAAECSSPGYRHIEYYPETNFLLLGLPLDF